MSRIAVAPLTELARAFARAGKQLYLVGGSVRDELLGRPHADLDFTTDALPEEVKALVRAARPDGVYTVGERFGTVGLVFGDLHVEVTTFRAEQYEPDSRKPAVQFGTSLVEDLSRRDFTINAMARDLATGELVDPYGGLADLKARLIRAVGAAEERFAEDPLRLLRAVRFAAELGFDVEPGTRAAIIACAEKLRTISWERIRDEMNRILLSERPALGIRLLCELGLMAFIIPEMLEMRGLRDREKRHKDVFEHTLAVVQRVPPVLHLRWAALLHDIAKPATLSVTDGEVHFLGHETLGAEMSRRILGRLRLDRNTIGVVAKLVRMHLRINLYDSNWTDGAVRRLAREAGDLFDDLFIISRADVTSQRAQRVAQAARAADELEARYRALQEEADLAKITSPLNGDELMSLFGRPPGKWIAPVKDYLLSLVLDGTLEQNDKEKAAELAREFVAKMGI
ncbi:MAG: CCA tRNA nucleotidyltransferase [Chloroflexi bacterium]|nr:CCA tRNA nucleotidyltransferase [Chloroflexota bacterium]